MNCDEAAPWLEAELDGELDALRAHALRRHLDQCPACTARRQSLRELSTRVKAELPRHHAPDALHARIREQLAANQATAVLATPRRAAWFWRGAFAGAFAGAVAASLVWLLALHWPGDLGGDDLPAALVALHTRATLSGQTIQVASSDQHVVKPWLSSQLDYTIPVQDHAAAGFALSGARTERLQQRRVAVLVYRHRNHVIDVFVRPGTAPGQGHDMPPVRGFNIAEAAAGELQWLAVSDLNAEALRRFVPGLAQGQVAPQLD